MTVELETRVRRANLVSQDRHLERLYEDDLSRRLLRDIYSKKEGRMSETTDRPEPTTVEEVPRTEQAFRPGSPSRPMKRSPALVPAIVTAVIAIGVIVALVARQPAPVVGPTPVEIGEQFMAALNAHDAAAVRVLLADDDAMTGEGVEAVDTGQFTIEQQLEQEEVLGWTYDVEACVDRTAETDGAAARVGCDYAFSNHLTRALETGPYEGSSWELLIVDGKIEAATNTEEDTEFHDETIRVFNEWLDANHPEVGGINYEYFDEENLAILKQYVPEFMAAMEEAG